MAESKSHGSLHWRILFGLLVGGTLGSLTNAFLGPKLPGWMLGIINYVMEPTGKVFLNLLVMTVIPLVFSSLALGVVRLGSQGSLGRVGFKSISYFLITMTTAVTIGLVLINLVAPGKRIPAETRDALEAQFQTEAKSKLAKADTDARLKDPVQFMIDTFVAIIPRNPFQAAVNLDMLAIIFVALLFGIGLTQLPAEQISLMTHFLDAVNSITIFVIELAMKIAPFGVFALIFTTTARFGFELLQSLGIYVLIVIVGLAIQLLIVFPILLRTLGGMNPIEFFRKTRSVMLTAFSTSSSNATLPTSMKVAQEELKIPAPIAGFVLPLGATMNMNGTALFEGVTVVFLAQVFGIELTMVQQVVIVIMCVLLAVGAAGVPGGSIPLMAIVLSVAGLPPEAIGIVLGVDRILDMCRTTLNVMGDLTAAVFIAKSEGAMPSTEAG